MQSFAYANPATIQEAVALLSAKWGEADVLAGGTDLIFTYDTQLERTGITTLLSDLNRTGIGFRDLRTEQSSLEDIFVGLVSDRQ